MRAGNITFDFESFQKSAKKVNVFDSKPLLGQLQMAETGSGVQPAFNVERARM